MSDLTVYLIVGAITVAAAVLVVLAMRAEIRDARRAIADSEEAEQAPAADPIDLHMEQAQTAAGADEAILRALAGASFGPKATLVLPSGRQLSSDEAQALTAFYAPAAEWSDR